MNLGNNFFKGIVPQPGIDGRINHGNEVPQGFGREKTPQVTGRAILTGYSFRWKSICCLFSRA